MAEDDNYIRAMPLNELLRAAAGALRWSHDELKQVNLEDRHHWTMEHPMRRQLLMLADQLDEVVAMAPSR